MRSGIVIGFSTEPPNAKKELKEMKKVKILEIGDMQNGFLREDGHLYVKGAQDIIDPTNSFLRRVCNRGFDFTLIIQDTHFAEEYSQTEESKMFPIHCEYGTNDWELAIDVSGLPNKRYLTKNQFNLWSEKSLKDIPFDDSKRKIAYDNLFHFVDNPHEPTVKSTREGFIKAISPASIEVTMLGVASDYCNRYAMEGWLGRGASVTIIHDLTKGIGKETPHILDEYQYQQYKNSRLRSVDSTEYIRELLMHEDL
jgi:nicotinamidase/pyrazinamidase